MGNNWSSLETNVDSIPTPEVKKIDDKKKRNKRSKTLKKTPVATNEYPMMCNLSTDNLLNVNNIPDPVDIGTPPEGLFGVPQVTHTNTYRPTSLTAMDACNIPESILSPPKQPNKRRKPTKTVKFREN
jgi:hypothetical protein